MIDPFDDEGERAARNAADLARLLVEHARVELARAGLDALNAEIEAHQAAERLEHAARQLRRWTKRTWIATVRCERARAHQ